MRPSKTLLLFTLSLCYFAPMAFSQDTSWYDMRWKEITTRQGAAYFRTKTRTNDGWAVTDHYLTGSPQMTGLYADDSQHIRKGEFQWYSNAGRVIHTCTYVDNKEEGKETFYREDGSVEMTGTNRQDEKDGPWMAYYPSGKLSGKAVYAKDKQISAEFFLEDGSPNKAAKVFMKSAEFPGGSDGFLQFLKQNFKYPKAAIKKEIQGTVIVGFMVTKDGKVADLTVIQSVDKRLDEEAVRVIRKAPRWDPAIQGGIPVDSYCKQPIVYRLED
jgi:TonB family protein